MAVDSTDTGMDWATATTVWDMAKVSDMDWDTRQLATPLGIPTTADMATVTMVTDMTTTVSTKQPGPLDTEILLI